jgi:hypothetical protein
MAATLARGSGSGEPIAAQRIGVGTQTDRDRHREHVDGVGEFFVVAADSAEQSGQECIVDRSAGGARCRL